MNYYVPLATVVVVFVVITILRERDFRRLLASQERTFNLTSQAQQKLLNQRDEEFTSVLDRLFASKNYAPSQVDLNQEYQRRQQKIEQVQRRNGGVVTRPVGIGPVDQAQRLMAQDVQNNTSNELQAALTKRREETATSN